MLSFEKRWTLELADHHERHLREIVDLGALAESRLRLSLLSRHPEHPNVTFGEKAVLEAALTVGLNVLARDLERQLGTPLEGGGDNQGQPSGPSGGGTPPTPS